MGEVVTFPGRGAADPAAARNLAGVAQARAALRRGRARAIDLDVDPDHPQTSGDDVDHHPGDERGDDRSGEHEHLGLRRGAADEGRR